MWVGFGKNRSLIAVSAQKQRSPTDRVYWQSPLALRRPQVGLRPCGDGDDAAYAHFRDRYRDMA